MPEIPDPASPPGRPARRAGPPDPDRAALAARARDIRHTAGVGFRAMWRQIGVNPSTLQRWETVGVPPLGRDPRADTWIAITRLLDVTNGTGG